MASVEKRTTLRDYIRSYLDDAAKDLITDEQIDVFIEQFTEYGSRSTEQLVCYGECFRSSYPGPVYDLEIDVVLSDDHTYRVDENSKFVQYVSGGTAPSDRDRITISYIEVNFNMLMAAVFEFLENAARKLTASQSAGGVSFDGTQLASAFRQQSIAWSCKGQWR